jgi:hypothetical protein
MGRGQKGHALGSGDYASLYARARRPEDKAKVMQQWRAAWRRENAGILKAWPRGRDGRPLGPDELKR